jgi:hypothetical protein
LAKLSVAAPAYSRVLAKFRTAPSSRTSRIFGFSFAGGPAVAECRSAAVPSNSCAMRTSSCLLHVFPIGIRSPGGAMSNNSTRGIGTVAQQGPKRYDAIQQHARRAIRRNTLTPRRANPPTQIGISPYFRSACVCRRAGIDHVDRALDRKRFAQHPATGVHADQHVPGPDSHLPGVAGGQPAAKTSRRNRDKRHGKGHGAGPRLARLAHR